MQAILRKLSAAVLVVVMCLLMDSCTGTKKGAGSLPTNLPAIALQGPRATPPHTLPSYTYPFDSAGNYVSDWAADGERRSGRSAATNSDADEWRRSHGGSSSKSKSKVASSSSKKSSSGKKGSSSGSKKSSGSSGGGNYVVKKGDTLSAIARRNGTSVSKLMAANGLSSDKLAIGKKLRVPRG